MQCVVNAFLSIVQVELISVLGRQGGDDRNSQCDIINSQVRKFLSKKTSCFRARNAMNIQSYMRKNVFVDYEYEIEYKNDFLIFSGFQASHYHNTYPIHFMSYPLYLRPT